MSGDNQLIDLSKDTPTSFRIRCF